MIAHQQLTGAAGQLAARVKALADQCQAAQRQLLQIQNELLAAQAQQQLLAGLLQVSAQNEPAPAAQTAAA